MLLPPHRVRLTHQRGEFGVDLGGVAQAEGVHVVARGDLCAYTVTGPHDRTSARRSGGLPLEWSAIRWRPHECHMLRPTKRWPQRGQVQRGWSLRVAIAAPADGSSG